MSAGSLRILTYHRVIEPLQAGGCSPSLISATPGHFERQMRHLVRRYRVVPAEDVLRALRGGRGLPRRAVLLTFDDAYCDFGEIVWPILRRHGLPAILFVPTAYPGSPTRVFWWDRLHRALISSSRAVLDRSPLGRIPLDSPAARHVAARALQRHLKTLPHEEAMQRVDLLCAELGEPPAEPGTVLNWEELRELAREGVTLGAHTRTHPALDRLPPEEARAEIRGSREDLEREVGSVLPVFAYPFGAHNDRVVDLTREEGFELAVTCLDGHNAVPPADPLRLRRTGITRRTSPVLFRMRLLSFAARMDAWRHQTSRRYESAGTSRP